MLPPDLNIAQFTKYMETINMLYHLDDDFKTLCDDFLISKAYLGKCKAKSVKDTQLEQEYKRLSWTLEKEIFEYIIRWS